MTSYVEILEIKEFINININIKEEAIKQGLSEGLKKGIEQGIEQGEKIKQREIVKEMLLNNIDINLIAKITKLTLGEINSIN